MSLRKFQNGDVVVVTNKISKWAQSQHKVKPGMVGTVMGYNFQGYYTVRVDNGTPNGVNVSEKSNVFEKGKPKSSIEMFTEQIEKAVAKIEATKAFITETKSKIAFMQEIGSDQFDENEFKAYHTLTIIEQSDMSKIEKAKAIAALIAGK
jgi:hypothetical protein